jgi:shikimate dehydrogenase
MPKPVYTLADLRDWPAATAGDAPPIRLSVIGDPVAHSRSPQMHNPALRAAGIDAAYTRLHISPAELAEALRLLSQNNFIGTNITIPHKSASLALMDQVDPQARLGGGVNTVIIHGGELIGHSTDGPGFSRAIQEDFHASLSDLRVMILGAGGGAGRAIAVQCAAESCVRLTLVNRTFSRAQSIACELAPTFANSLNPIPWDPDAIADELAHTDLIINATPLGMPSAGEKEATLPHPIIQALRPRHLIYDTVYAHSTPLLEAAIKAGARSSNGLSMLLHQGALSFELWFNRPAPLEVMRAALLGKD